MVTELNGKELESLRDAIVGDFEEPEAARVWIDTWIKTAFPSENVNNIFYGDKFDAMAHALLTWAVSVGSLSALLQELADRSPTGKRLLRGVVFVVSRGTITPRGAAGVAPVEPHRDWFVTKRPFATRHDLRQALATFDNAEPGPDSVLVIEGTKSSGKSFSVRFARQCAPPRRYVPVDVAHFESGQMNAEDLTRALAPPGGGGADTFPDVDLTKENEAVPRLFTWLKSKLAHTNTWLIVDHCDRPNLTEAARALLIVIARAIDDLSLPGVRLILADIARSKLPDGIRMHCRYDRAVLPNERHVADWCRDLAAHLGRQCDEAAAASLAADVFKCVATIRKEEVPFAIEQGLARAARRIQELPRLG
jgi:hypothetical protein